MRYGNERERKINLTVCYRQKQMDVSFSCDCPVIENEFPHNIASWIHSYFDNVMTKFMINNRTDAWKTDVNLLIEELFTGAWVGALAMIAWLWCFVMSSVGHGSVRNNNGGQS